MKFDTQEWNLISVSTVISALPSHQIARSINWHTQEYNLINASIVISTLLIQHIASSMSVFIQEWNLISISTVITALAYCQIASDMSVHIQAWNPISASIVISALDVHQLVSNMNVHTQERNPISLTLKNCACYLKFISLIQLIKELTRIVERSSTLLDLAFTTDQGKISDSGVLECSISDHSLVYIIRKARPPRGPIKTIKCRSYKNYSAPNFVRDLHSLPLGMSLTPLSRSMRLDFF